MRLAIFCLGTSALTMPALAAVFSVGGGTITTTHPDTSQDNTGASGGFLLQPNTAHNNDVITVTGVTINNTSGAPNGRALDLGHTLASTGSYSIIMQGSNLSATAGSGVAALIASSSGGSFDSSGGAANTISGPLGINLNGNGGNVSIKTGADTITTSGASGEILYATTTGTGTIAIDTAGATLSSAGTYGISAVTGGSGAITIGGQNGGIASNITVTGGYGIHVTSVLSTINVTLASTGSITALNGMRLQGGATTVNSSGIINATNSAIDGTLTSSLTVNLLPGSSTSGLVLGGSGADTFNLFGGANITGAIFDPGGGFDTLTLTGSGNGNFDVTSAGNTDVLQKTGTGTWTLTGTTTLQTPWTISGGALSIADDAALGASSGTLVLDGGMLGVTATTTATRAITLGPSGGIFFVEGGRILTENGVISGPGALTVGSPLNGGVILNGTNTYSGGTIVNGGTLRLGINDGLPVGGGLTMNGGAFDLNGHTQTIASLNGFDGTVNLSGGILLINTATNASFGFPSLGGIAGTGAIIFNGTGTQGLNGANSTTTASITVNTGTLSIGGSLGGGNDITVNGGKLVFVKRTMNLGKLAGTGGTLDIDGSVLTFNSAVDSTYAGAIVDTASNPSLVQFTKAGTGVLTLTGASTATDNVAITGGTLQFGNGGTSGGFARGNITNNATLIFNRSDSYDYIGDISGTGTVVKTGTGRLKIIGNLAVAGGTTISTGTLEVQSLSPSGLSGNIVNNSALIITPPVGMNYGGVISGTGALTVNGQPGTALTLTNANTYTGGTVVNGGLFQLGTGGSLAASSAVTVNAGTFDLNGHTQTVGNLSGTGGAITLGSGSLTTNTSANSVLASAISGSGSLTKIGTGTLTLTGANSYTGGTTLLGGALQIGDGGTTGSLAGNIFNGNVIGFNRSDNITYGGVISGHGGVLKFGAGTLTLSGINTYTGDTGITAGTLNVTGAVANSKIFIGSTLSGTGTVGPTTILNGATLAPGNSIGTLTVNGNLTLAAGSIYSVEVSPTAADRTIASGSASLNGTVAASVASGTYNFGQRFTILTAGGGVSGTFASLTGIPAYLKGQLSYDTNNTYLTLSPNTLAPLISNATPNQQKLVSAIDAAVTSGNTPGAGFQALYGLSGPALNSALDQISGQVGANTINAVGQASLSFLNMTAQGGSGGGNFAPGSAFGGADAPHRAQLGAGETRVWGAAYGGHVGLSADAASGAASLSASNVGLIGGVDMAWDQGLLAGVTFGLGRQNFSSGNGTGSSDDIMIGLYARKDFGPLYVTAAFGYGSHHIETLRVITVSGTDVLQGKQHADDYGGRIEAGWRTALDEQFTLSPYFAVAAQSFESAAYAESALSGASTFALSVAARSSTLGRTELGSGLSRDYETENGVMTADLRLAWAHQLDDLPLTQASFQTLPGASFLVTGVRPASDTALLGAGVQVQNRSGLFFGFKGESQLGAGTTILQGMGHLGWRW